MSTPLFKYPKRKAAVAYGLKDVPRYIGRILSDQMTSSFLKKIDDILELMLIGLTVIFGAGFHQKLCIVDVFLDWAFAEFGHRES